MDTKRIVLKIPFVRHPAGSVFELCATTGLSGWNPDDPTQEKRSFIGKQFYRLPDGGNGREYELSLSDTMDCPPGLFDESLLLSGPCRITRAAFAREDAPDEKWNPGFNLTAGDRHPAQGFEFPLDRLNGHFEKMDLYDRMREEHLLSLPVQPQVDAQTLPPGFYELRLSGGQGDPFSIFWIKSFPIVLQFDKPGGPFTVLQTLY